MAASELGGTNSQEDYPQTSFGTEYKTKNDYANSSAGRGAGGRGMYHKAHFNNEINPEHNLGDDGEEEGPEGGKSGLFDVEIGDVTVENNIHVDENRPTPTRKRKRTRRKRGYDLDLELDQCDDDDTEDHEHPKDPSTEITRGGKTKRSFCNRILNECVSILCPCFLLIRALCRCDMALFYRLSSSIFVLKAFWSSFITLGICTLFKVHRVIPGDGDDPNSTVIEAYLFGLWTYTANFVENDKSLEGLIEGEFERIETCSFHMQRAAEDSPDNLFLNDASFIIARVCAGMVVGIGLFGMVSVLLIATNVFKSCCFGRKMWLLPTMLASCSVLESFVFLVFASSVCRDTKYEEQRHCSLEQDSGIVFVSVFSWLVAAVASIKVQSTLYGKDHHVDVVESASQEDFPSGARDKQLDRTFDDDDSSSDDSTGRHPEPSRFEIS